MSQEATATKRLVALLLLCAIIGFCFVLIGTFGPNWVVARDHRSFIEVSEGIWLATLCRNYSGEQHCHTSTRDTVLDDAGLRLSITALDDEHWLEFKVLSVFAIVGSFVAVTGTTVVLVKRSNKYTWLVLTIGGVSSLATSMFLLVPVLKISAAAANYDNTHTSWSLVLGASGSALHFLSTLIHVRAVYRSCRQCCDYKTRAARRQRRNQMVVQYLTAQTDDVSENGLVYFTQNHAFTSTESDSGVGSGSVSPRYAGSECLPSYDEITVR